MPDEIDESRDRLHLAVQNESEWLSERDGSLLVGWILVSEWMDSDGDRWLSEAADEHSTMWNRMGYLTASLETHKEKWEAKSDDA